MANKKCIFCKGRGMSKEHFWPAWLSSHFNKTSSCKHTSEFHLSEGKAPFVLRTKNERSGKLITKKFRVVCRSCNNGWMSLLDEKVKPMLISMLENKDITFSEEDLLILSRWVVMKVIVAEQSEEGTQVTPEIDRYSFFENKKIPDYFRVYIGRQKTIHDSAYLRHSATLSLSPKGPSPSLNGMKRNTQTVSFLIGPLFVYVIAARIKNLNLERSLNLSSLMCIFPKGCKELNWITLKELEQSELSSIAYTLNDLISSPRVKYGGPLPNQ